MPQNEIDALTSEAFAARDRGDNEAAQAAFSQRDAVAKASSGEQLESAPDIGEAGVSAESLDQISEILTSTGNADMCDARLSATVRSAHAFAQEFERSNPTLAAEIAELAAADPQVYAAVLKYAASQNRQSARQAPATQPTRNEQMAEPVLTSKETLQDEIAAMSLKLSTEEGRSARFQRRWTELHERLHGTEPIPGRGGISVR